MIKKYVKTALKLKIDFNAMLTVVICIFVKSLMNNKKLTITEIIGAETLIVIRKG